MTKIDLFSLTKY